MRTFINIIALCAMVLVGFSCSKNDPPADPCAGVTVTVTGSTMNPASGASNGSIVASASGGSGFTYSLNNGAFQATGQFTNLSAGTYTITAKSSAGCSGSASFTLTNVVNCNTVTIAVNPTPTGVTPCVNASGSITAAASGGTAPYTYSLNGGTFQSAATFASLNTGTFSITAKDANGCTGTQGSIVVGTRAAGSLFTAVRTIIQNNCVSCHNASNASGGVNLSNDCAIVSAKDRINARAVQGNPSPMPTSGLLPVADRQAITNWINAGGRVTD
ncbi:MAG: SprB repeat-containing protein [Bacteroidota bacterium]